MDCRDEGKKGGTEGRIEGGRERGREEGGREREKEGVRQGEEERERGREQTHQCYHPEPLNAQNWYHKISNKNPNKYTLSTNQCCSNYSL